MSISPKEFQNSKRKIGRYNMRSPGVSFKGMYRGIHKIHTSKGVVGGGREVSVQKRTSTEQTNTNALALASWQSCWVKISKFCSFKFLLPLKLTNKKDIDKAQLLLLLEISSDQIWKMTFSKWHSQSLNAAEIILKWVYSLGKTCLQLHRFFFLEEFLL